MVGLVTVAAAIRIVGLVSLLVGWRIFSEGIALQERKRRNPLAACGKKGLAGVKMASLVADGR